MKLYFSPGACSLSPHIVALELGIEVTLEDVTKKVTADGKDYLGVNPKGYVPALQLDNGELLTEGPVIVQYLADQKPGNKLLPAYGTMERYRVMEMLSYISTEIHKTYSPLFTPDTTAEVRAEREAYLRRRYALVEKLLAGKSYLFGDNFTPADAYLFVVTSWAGYIKLDLSEFPNLMAFQERVAARPAVQAALKAEGLAG
ncbi:MAG: glutathione transferase GstA [Myxococcales bacterium]|nr:glutathione transferase GstA [Myxococcales bacterium]